MMNIGALIFYILVNICLGSSDTSPCEGIADKNSTKEGQLMECLFKNYNTLVRPANDSSQTVQVNVSFYIVAVSQVYDKENAVLLETFIGQDWYDHRLKWNPNDYGGIRRILVDYWQIWEPEMTVWDNRDSTGTIVEGKKAVVSFQGKVEWLSQIRLSTYCWMDHAKFPFDQQICHFQFQHQVYDTSLVKNVITYPLKGEDLPCYSLHAEWIVKVCHVQVEKTNWRDLDLSYTSLEIVMERQYSYHYYLIVMPSILVVLFTLSLLWLPHESYQRFVAIGGMLFVILLTNFILQQFLPPSIGEVPAIASYLLYSIIVLIMIFTISLITHNFHEKDPKVEVVPDIVKKFFFNAIIGKATCVLITPYIYMPNASLENRTWNEPIQQSGDVITSGSIKTEHKTDVFGQNTKKLLGDICKNLKILNMHVPCKTQLVQEWKQLALIIDRLSFYIFFLVNVVITTTIYAH